jgi:hypothetical protein
MYTDYFTEKGPGAIFNPLEKTGNHHLSKWISKSKHALNYYSHFLVLLKRFEKEPVDKYTCQAIHLSLASCSESIVFSLFNIFSLVTKTEAAFYDVHIRDYLAAKHSLSPDELNVLSFNWHQPIQNLNGLVYSADEKFVLHNSKNDLGFQIAYFGNTNESETIIGSVDFFTTHLQCLHSTIGLLCTLLARDMALDGISNF